jgi:DNA-binding transcriptional LysR family regulator
VIDVRRLKILKAVVDTGSVSAAAAALSYTPSAVSQHLSALERETGSLLFEKAGRGLRPTEAALVLHEHAARVLAALQDAEEALVTLHSGNAGRLRVAAFPTAGSSVVPGALAAFQRQLPNVSLELVVVETDDAVVNLRAGSIDVAVVVATSGPDRPPSEDGLVHRHLVSDPFRVVLPRGHTLAERRTVALEGLSAERWIGVTSCPGYCQQVVTEACRKAGFEPHYGLEADEYPTAQGFVAAGLGVALVPLLAIAGSAHPGVVVRRLKGHQPVREVWAMTRPAIADQLQVRTMVESLAESAKNFLRNPQVN